MKKLIAIILYKLGAKPNVSTGICGKITRGYGKLSTNGYWEYQIN